jgi:hypothetical protein
VGLVRSVNKSLLPPPPPPPDIPSMAEEFELNSLLSTLLDDCNEIQSEFEASSLSQKEVEAQVNGM